MTIAWMTLVAALPALAGWPMMDFDTQRTGRHPGTGQIKEPKLAWQKDFSAIEYFLAATPASGKGSLQLKSSAGLKSLSLDEKRAWGMAIPQLDVMDNGNLVNLPGAPGARWGKFMPDIVGLQRLSWTTTWGDNAHFLMHSFQDGLDKPITVWDIAFEGATYSPLVVIKDIDGDGIDEAILSTWHGAVAYSLLTGEEKYRCMYRQSHGRQYGFMGAYTDPLGHAYIVVIGDFAGHIGVLAIRNGELQNLWYHKFDPQSEQGIDRRFTINTIGPNPIGDFNDDKRGEILMNVYNESGDGRWHLLAYDLETGEHSLDLPDVYLHGHVGNKLLTQYCPKRPVATNGEIRLYKWNEIIWKHSYGRWSMTTLPQLPLTHITGATRGMDAPVTDEDESRIFYTAANNLDKKFSLSKGERLHALDIASDKKIKSLWKVKAPKGVYLDAVSAKVQVLIRAKTDLEKKFGLRSRGIQMKAVAAQRINRGAPQPLVLKDNKNGLNQIIVAEPLDSISGWAVQQENSSELQRLWKCAGRAMTTQVPQMMGLAAGDLDRDGSDEILCVQEAGDGHSRLVAVKLDGRKRWHYDFHDFGGRAPVWNECGTTIWAVGHFADPDRLDVMVSNRRSIMHSDETVILNSKEKSIIWHRDIIEVKPPWSDAVWIHTRGYGGGPAAIADFTGSGTDDIALCYPAEYSIIEGHTGRQYLVKNKGPLEGTDNFWVFGGTPLAADLNSDDRLEALLVAPSMILAFTNQENDAEILWRTEADDGATGTPAIGDTDGDGRLEIGLPGFKDGFRCLDAATGKILWTVPSQDSGVSNCIAVDINGDGIEEFLYANVNRLIAVAQRDGGDPIIWEMALPTQIQNIAVADVDNDGNVEILAGGNDGMLYCIK